MGNLMKSIIVAILAIFAINGASVEKMPEYAAFNHNWLSDGASDQISLKTLKNIASKMKMMAKALKKRYPMLKEKALKAVISLENVLTEENIGKLNKVVAALGVDKPELFDQMKMVATGYQKAVDLAYTLKGEEREKQLEKADKLRLEYLDKLVDYTGGNAHMIKAGFAAIEDDE